MKIHAPNGDIIEFPDDTPDSTILDVMRREYGGPVPEAANQPEPRKGSTQPITGAAEDVAKSAVSGLGRGVLGLAGIPGGLEWAAKRGAEVTSRAGWGSAPTGQPDTLAGAPRQPEQPSNVSTVLPTPSDMISAFERNVAPFHTPQTRAGRYARTIGEFAPSAAIPVNAVGLPAQIAARVGSNVVAPALASEAAGEATAGSAMETPARIAAALVAPYAPRAAMRAVTPLPAEPTRTAAAALLEGEGVPLTAGQRTGSTPLRYAESAARETPFAGGRIRDITERQGEAFTRAALRRVGADADRATPDVMIDTRNRIGAEFDRITQNPLPLNAQTRNDIANRLGAAFRNYLDQVPSAAHRPFVERFMQDVLDALHPPGQVRPATRIPGETVQAWRSRLSRMAGETTDPEYGAFLRHARETLDDIYGRSLPADEAAAWAEARRQWGALRELQDARARGGEAAASGVVTPGALSSADRVANALAFVEGRGHFSDLATAGQTVMTPLPNSGTPGRAMAMSIPSALAGAAGHMAGGDAILPAMAGAASTPAMLRLISSRPVQAYLGNQRLVGALNTLGPTSSMFHRGLMLPAQMPDQFRPSVSDALVAP